MRTGQMEEGECGVLRAREVVQEALEGRDRLGELLRAEQTLREHELRLRQLRAFGEVDAELLELLGGRGELLLFVQTAGQAELRIGSDRSVRMGAHDGREIVAIVDRGSSVENGLHEVERVLGLRRRRKLLDERSRAFERAA